jgi:hypothetical protein
MKTSDLRTRSKTIRSVSFRRQHEGDGIQLQWLRIKARSDNVNANAV